MGNNQKNKIEQNNKKKIQHSQLIAIYLVCYDIIAVAFSCFAALWLRCDLKFSMIPPWFLEPWKQFVLFYVIISIAVFWVFRLYKSVWRFASYTELQRVTVANMITALLHIVCITVFFRRMPISYYIMGAFIQYALTVGIRFSYRFVLLLRHQREKKNSINTLVVGAGAAGNIVLRELKRSNPTNEKVVCIIDDNKNKWNRDIDGVPIIGGRNKILAAVEKYNIKKIYIAIPSVSEGTKSYFRYLQRD